MNEKMLKTLVEIILILLYHLESASDDDLNEDFSVKLMEQSAASLQSLAVDDTKAFLNAVSALSDMEADPIRKKYLQDFGENFGIADMLA